MTPLHPPNWSLGRLSATSARFRGPLWLWVLISVALVVFFGYLRVVVYPDRFVPLASSLALLVGLWHRDRRLVWGMAGAFIALIAVKVTFLLPADALRGGEQWVFAGMQLANTFVAAVIVDAMIRLMDAQERNVALLEQANAELEASNEELAAREEEIAQQNEELQSQTEELEQQTEELNAQAEELQSVNEQLGERERSLVDLLETTAGDAGESEALAKLGETIERLLAGRAMGAALLEVSGEEMVIHPLFGVRPGPATIRRERTLGELALRRRRAAALADVALRPDLDLPALAHGVTRSVAAAPLAFSDVVAGVLEVYSTEPTEWPERDLRLVQWLAEQCGRLLTTSRLKDERERLLQAEHAARRDAEQANRAKDEFVATLSHELRTPLNAVLGWAALLKRSGCTDSAEMLKGVDVIERNARHQAQLISDLLDISRILAGKARLDVHVVDLPLVIENALESVRPAAEAKDVRIEHDLETVDRAVIGDPTRLQQVVWNLLTNAIKFTPRGGEVRVSVARVASYVQIKVSDTGDGIDPDLLPWLFGRYRQADSSFTRRHGGLGLGLAITKHIVELHGGTIEARSEGLGKGATFSVLLPVRAAHAGSGEPAESPCAEDSISPLANSQSLRDLAILVVDDEPDARELVGRILSDCGAKVTLAASGCEALRVLGEQRPNVLVSDIGMPEMDGFALIREVRSRYSDDDRRLVAVALTAYARPEDRTRTLLAGFHSHVAKPVEPVELVATIARLANPGSRPQQENLTTETTE
jgi:signal transduction histidine kinase/ActR/RegA family two-component response regulator